MKALQIIEDFTDDNGLLVWEKESDKINVQAKKKIDRFEAAKEAYTSGKNYKAEKGEHFVPDLKLHYWVPDTEWPTFSEWVESQNSEEPDPNPPEEPRFVQG